MPAFETPIDSADQILQFNKVNILFYPNFVITKITLTISLGSFVFVNNSII